MLRDRKNRKGERGASIVEFAIAASLFFVAMFGVLEFGHMFWVHNALADAARRGARYAVLHPSSDTASVKNVVVYGDPAGGSQPLVNNLTTGNVNVTYSGFGLAAGTVSVGITGYQYKFIMPLIGSTINMPGYNTTLTGESAGYVPPNM